MAGMLPGVESARRRRFHQGGSMNSASGSRRPSFCLYTTGVEPHLNASSVARSGVSKGFHGGELGEVARGAKERLDGRLRNQLRSTEIKRHNSAGGGDSSNGLRSTMMLGNIQREVFSLKKSARKFSWSKLGWKSSEQSECAVCLENFKTGDILVHLPCAHHFHWNCAMPWLESNSQCPCCRMSIYSQVN
ncbi:uncharacterized protein A4U43_C08F8120 [Asparagus officinalis]|uniref:probable E3 ubiquitin-protein ligase ATL44 n=1 Tax=Asparagus officinalis TaxID=4686 RepID=UPI00098DFE53|nr:probable E3 ubiquitin-protein ligase ATL44 [Asparagus officinalis]ONK59599.1 uncharacterized protein A4U43_C08F8120 [Asparagus officinalis]